MELQSPHKYGIDNLTRHRRDLLLSAANRTSFLEQKTRDENIQDKYFFLTTPRPNTKFRGGCSVSGNCVSAEL
jgi:hypothetical protein